MSCRSDSTALARAAEAVAGDRRSAPVLIADRDRARAASVASVLEDAGYEVTCAHDDDTAWETLRLGRHATVIRGWGSQPEGGLIERIRRSENRSYTYVIVLGNSAEIASNDRIMRAGADDFLVHPADQAALIARLRVADRIVTASKRLEEANLEMRRDRAAAARVQQALLPKPGLEVPGMSIAWRLRPCDELGGDILNCMRLDEHHVAFYVLDVSGHGISSAMLSVQVSRLMSPMMSESELLKERLSAPPWYRVVQPLRVVERLNELFQMESGANLYFTMVYGLLHLKSRRLRLATAGHPGPIHVPQGTRPRVLTCRSRPIGLFEESAFHVQELTLDRGDRLWLYSDGVTEVADARQQMLTTEGLLCRIDAQRERPLADGLREVMSAVETWCAPGAPADDCTLLAIELD